MHQRGVALVFPKRKTWLIHLLMKWVIVLSLYYFVNLSLETSSSSEQHSNVVSTTEPLYMYLLGRNIDMEREPEVVPGPELCLNIVGPGGRRNLTVNMPPGRARKSSDLSFIPRNRKYRIRNATRNFLPGHIKILIHNPGMCAGQKLDYVVYIHSSPSNVNRRYSVRTTWGNTELFRNFPFKILFLFGKPKKTSMQEALELENRRFGDIIQGDFIDDYKNLTLKAIMGLQWLSEHCPDVPFVIKADDDAFINIFEVLSLVNKAGDKNRTMMCALHRGNMPILRDRTKCSKWCIKEDEFPGDRYYPPYCAGLAYIMGMGVMKELRKAVLTTPFFWIDDVYVTGLLTQKVTMDIEYVNLVGRFTLNGPRAVKEFGNISIPLNYDLVHMWTASHLISTWKALLKRIPTNQLKMINNSLVDSVRA